MPDGREVFKFHLANSNGIKVSLINYGAIITSIFVPDKRGNANDIVLGFDNMEGYLQNRPYFGAVIGRVANRISNAKFVLNGKTVEVSQNGKGYQLHGGIEGFDKKLWEAATFNEGNTQGVKFSYFSKEGEEGYPGNLQVEVHYILTSDNELIIRYHAETDGDTVVNLTNHSYFNLKGEGNGDIYGHILKIDSGKYLPLTEDTLVPTGEIAGTKGTPYDFTNGETIGKRIDMIPPGYDISYVLNGKRTLKTPFAEVLEPETGRFMQVFTTQPAVQLYTGNYLDGITGKNRHKYFRHYAFCLETQAFPDAPNHPGFPSILLKKGDKYRQTTKFKFGVKF